LSDPYELVDQPDVDLVTVSVRVSAHVELVRAALEAGKHVSCEWPVARRSEEAAALLELARGRGVHDAVGLQARYAPELARARDLIAEGYVGRVTSVTVYSSLELGADGQIDERPAYTLSSENGAGLLQVACGRTLDAVQQLVGTEIATVSATLATQRPCLTVTETGEVVQVTVPDHVLLSGALKSGALLSTHIHQGKRHGARTWIEISGTSGDLTLESRGQGNHPGLQMHELRLLGAGEELAIPSAYYDVPEAVRRQPALNVARLYTRLADNIHTGQRTVPGFADALRLHQLLDTIERTGW
jgi:predicted dehydrogenase